MQPEGKEAMKEDFKKFSTAASSAYKNLPLSERKGLKLRSAERSITLSSGAAKREVTKIFNQIQNLVRHYNNNNNNNNNNNKKIKLKK